MFDEDKKPERRGQHHAAKHAKNFDRFLDLIEPLLQNVGHSITLNDAWLLVRMDMSYSMAGLYFKKAMDLMIEQGKAARQGRSKRGTYYEILKPNLKTACTQP